jgi:hypothetical protein
MRPKHSRDPLLPYRSKELVKQIVTIQCNVLLHRPGETDEIELESLAKPRELIDVIDEFHNEDFEHCDRLMLQGDEI